MYYVYFLQSESDPSKIYTGKTSDLQRRLAEHNSDDNMGWTRSYKPWNIDAYVACEDEAAADIVEAYFKSSSGTEKLKGFAKANPMHPHPKQGFFDALLEGRGFGKSENKGGNGRFVVTKINGQTVLERVNKGVIYAKKEKILR